MKEVTPKVYLIGEPQVNWGALESYLSELDPSAMSWIDRAYDEHAGTVLVEFAGKLCYRSFAPGLNPNVSKVTEDSEAYIAKIIASGHGSVLEHINYNFVFENVSRVFTHEWVRHRAGVAISQESLRYVRLTDLDMWIPEALQEAWHDPNVGALLRNLIHDMEQIQHTLADFYGLDEPELDFNTKKQITSAMRRFAPIGLATSMVWTGNVRTIRHIIEMRSSYHAEEEVRIVSGQIGDLMVEAAPYFFGDYKVDMNREWTTEHRKV